MKRRYMKTTLVVTAVLAMLGFGTYAFAEWGMGYGRQNYGGGPGWGHGECRGGGYGPGIQQRGFGYGGPANLSPDEAKKLEEERQAFHDATKDLRQSLYQKQMEIQAELTKKDPDPSKAQALQKEISDYKSQMGQKRLEHHLKMKKLFPELTFPGQGFGGRHMARGFGHGPGCRY